MKRRNFLFNVGGILLGQTLVGCNGKNQSEFQVLLLKDSIPGYVVNQFNKRLQSDKTLSHVKLSFVPKNQIYDLFKQLQTWQQTREKSPGGKKAPHCGLVTLGDYWLKPAIEQKLIRPLPIKKSKQWSSLQEKWQQLVKRDDQGNWDSQGKVWGAPYRWGNTVLVYNQNQLQNFNWQPIDWSDLWRSDLRSRISLPNHPREVIGLVLKKLGRSYNTVNPVEIPNLKIELESLNQQVKFYNSTNYLEPLITGDTWLAVGWSNDIIPILSRYPQLRAVIPQSGTAIWADIWVQPANTLITETDKTDNLISQWIDFCWQPDIARQIVMLTKTSTPVVIDAVNEQDITESARKLLLVDKELLDKSEFLKPLSLASINQYESLFMEMKLS